MPKRQKPQPLPEEKVVFVKNSLCEPFMPERDFRTGLPNPAHPANSTPPAPAPAAAQPMPEPSPAAPSARKKDETAEKPLPARERLLPEYEDSAPIRMEDEAEPEPVRESSRPEVSPLQGFRYLGQVARTYLVLSQNDDTLLLLDQHAMHERIFYEKFRENGSRGVARPLLVPLEMDLHPAEKERFLELEQTLTRLGFEASCRGNRLSVRAMPPEMERSDASAFRPGGRPHLRMDTSRLRHGHTRGAAPQPRRRHAARAAVAAYRRTGFLSPRQALRRNPGKGRPRKALQAQAGLIPQKNAAKRSLFLCCAALKRYPYDITCLISFLFFREAQRGAGSIKKNSSIPPDK